MFAKRNHKTKQESQKLLIYGRHPVISALLNPKRKYKNLYTTKNIWQELEPQFTNLNITPQILQPHNIDAMLPPGSNHQNIVLEALPLKPLDLEDILDQVSAKKNSCLVILDQITDPHNVGAIIRSAAAFSVDAVILPDHHSPKENNTILKCAAGACESVPMINVTNLVSCIKALKNEGYWIIGLDGHTDTILNESIFSNKIAIVLGSEDTGMRKLTKENCDYTAKIAISANLESLNVSNAAAIALYEFSKYVANV
jgi:23S rRNA (guanosine2251-2'-O)-methyltransferase